MIKMIVTLGKLRKKRAGWRAKEGRFFSPSIADIARQAVAEDKEVDQASDLISLLNVNWTNGAKKYGLTVFQLIPESEMEENAEKEGYVVLPEELNLSGCHPQDGQSILARMGDPRAINHPDFNWERFNALKSTER